MNTSAARLALITLFVFASMVTACQIQPAKHDLSFEERIPSRQSDAAFLFRLERVMLENGFTIHERALDSTGYRYIVTWVVPTAKGRFWQPQYRQRYNGHVVASRPSSENVWTIGAYFGVYQGQLYELLTQDFDYFVVQPLNGLVADGRQ